MEEQREIRCLGRLPAEAPFRTVLFLVVALCATVSRATAGSPAVSPGETVTITGQFAVRGGGSMAGGWVLLFNAENGPRPDFTRYTRLPDIFGTIDSQGKFSVQPPPGTYYIGAIKRLSGGRLGLPEPGDYRFLDRDESGAAKAHVLKPNDRLDMGVLEAVPLKKKEASVAGYTAITGAVTDQEGKPVENILVFAFASLERRPIFVSGKTGKDGRYVLRLAPGSYYLRARDVYGGGKPRPEGLVGFYGEQDPGAVDVKSGETRTGINIKVFRAQVPSSGRSPAPSEQGKRRK